MLPTCKAKEVQPRQQCRLQAWSHSPLSKGLSQQWPVGFLLMFLTGIVHHHVQGTEEEEQAPEEAPPVVIEDAILLSDQELLRIIKVSFFANPVCSEHIYQLGR